MTEAAANSSPDSAPESLPAFDAAAQVLPQSMDLALQCHHDKQWAEAAALYNIVLRLQSDHPDANHNLGAIAVEQGDPLAAIPLFQIALQSDPKSSPYWTSLVDVLMQALDCFPQNSGTTLYESLYMGLPFISLAGVPSMGTLGASILTSLGRTEWIAYSNEGYLEKLVALASDVPALAELRSGLRAEMEASPLMDEPGFARDVEDAYFAMFQRWIDATPEGT